MCKQKDCSALQSHYIYKNISLKLGIAPKHFYKYKSITEGPKACEHTYVCINILLPLYIKVTSLKTILTYKQIKVEQSTLDGLNMTWHMVWGIRLCDTSETST